MGFSFSSSCYCTSSALDDKVSEDQCSTNCNGKPSKYPKCGGSSNKRTVLQIISKLFLV